MEKEASEIIFEAVELRHVGKCDHEHSDILMIVPRGYLPDREVFEPGRRCGELRLCLRQGDV